MTLTSVRLATALLVAALPATARAEPVDDTSTADPTIALGLALAGTAAGATALYAGSAADSATIGLTGIGLLVIGPSLGHFYAGEPGRAVRHAAVRAGAVAVMGAGLLVAWSSPCAFGPENDDHCPRARDGIGVGVMAAGALLGAGSVVYSVIDAPRAAHRTSTILAPAPLVAPGGSTTVGLALTGPL